MDNLDDQQEASQQDDLEDRSSDDDGDSKRRRSRRGSASRDELASESDAASNSDDSTDDSSSALDRPHKGQGGGKDDKRRTPGADSFNVVDATEVPPGNTGLYEGLATPLRDKLTGLFNGAKVRTTYTWRNLGDSLLSSRGRASFDVVENFTVSKTPGESDELVAPLSITTTSIDASNGKIKKLVAGQINAKALAPARFTANSAAAFTCKGFDGLFVAFNDARDGYQQNSDTLVFLKGYDIASGPLVVN